MLTHETPTPSIKDSHPAQAGILQVLRLNKLFDHSKCIQSKSKSPRRRGGSLTQSADGVGHMGNVITRFTHLVREVILQSPKKEKADRNSIGFSDSYWCAFTGSKYYFATSIEASLALMVLPFIPVITL